MKLMAIIVNGISSRIENPIFKMIRYSILILIVISAIVPLSAVHSKSSDDTTSSKIILVAKKIILNAAKLGLEEAGTRLMGSTWPYFKAAMSPILTELKERYPGFASALDASGPNAEAEASRAINEISNDPKLQALIIDGFANIQNGQREIVNRIGEMEEVLHNQNESIINLHIASDKKIDKLIASVERLERQQPMKIYTEGITMFDLEGVWTLVNVEPPLPASCQFEQGKYGVWINVVDAMNATGGYTIPFPVTAEDKELLFPDLTTNCPSIQDKNRKFAIFGSILRMQIEDNMYFAREIKVISNYLILSWVDDDGQYHQWRYIKNP